MRRVAATALALALIHGNLGAWGAEDKPLSLATQVHTIFQVKCVECHGPEVGRPKGKFGYVLDLARVAANPKMIVPGKPLQSELYQMVWHNEMPDPKGNTTPLTPEQKDIVRSWIEAGAPAGIPPESPSTLPKLTLDRRIVRDIGQFHPPVTHFPIALFIVAIPAEFMWTLTRKDSWKATVRFCVALGAVAAVAAAALGWCDAAFVHYSSVEAPIVLWHRWFGTATAAWAILVVLFSEFANRRGNPDGLCFSFRMMLLVGVILVTATGYLGASLIYGLHHVTW